MIKTLLFDIKTKKNNTAVFLGGLHNEATFHKTLVSLAGKVHSGSHSPVPAYISRGERKPSSAEEELAVVSLLQLHTGLASDDNATSSSTE